jgi:hypothetical protein
MVGAKVRTDPWYPLRYELARSRRYQKGFVLAAGRVGTGEQGGRRLKGALQSYAHLVRDTDAVWTHRGRLYILLAETSADEAGDVIDRLGQSVADAVRITDVRTASFPGDGLTSAALIAAVSEDAPARAGGWQVIIAASEAAAARPAAGHPGTESGG